MRPDRAALSLSERSDLTVMTALLFGRLASVETVDWALSIKSHETIKRIAVLDLIDSPDGRKLREPWRSAWRLIEEAWDDQGSNGRDQSLPYATRDRVQNGDRSGALIEAITSCVVPGLRIAASSRRTAATGKKPQRPRTVSHILSAHLGSGDVVDPQIMGLDQIVDDAFLLALANALEGALVRGLDTARRLGWNGRHEFYPMGQLYRVAFVPESERGPDEHEPDEFHEGIAPCAKLLHFVVERLGKSDALAAKGVLSRWRLTPTPIHLRLWAALARNAHLVDPEEVEEVLVALSDEAFWDVQLFPELAELRALRFVELNADAQRTLLTRLDKGPPRRLWPRNADRERVANARRYCSARELRRIEVAGGVLAGPIKTRLTAASKDFSDLAAMTRLDEGFLTSPQASWVQPAPDMRYDSLFGNERLSTLEKALGAARGGWDDDQASSAWDWLRATGNAAKLISDFELSRDVPTSYPKTWKAFGSAHSPAAGQKTATPEHRQEAEVFRVLSLLKGLPGETVIAAIDGLCNWLSNWRSIAIRSPEVLAVWVKLWPIAVEVTNSAQPAGAPVDLNLVARSSDGREPMDLDTLNTPVGHLVSLFLAACPTVNGQNNPFSSEGLPRTMREAVIATSGHSGLIVRYRLIEHLHYFLRADPAWTSQHLSPLLQAETDDAISLWRALGRRTQFLEVLKLIGPEMVRRASDLRLGRETRQSLAFSLVNECLNAHFHKRDPAVPFSSVQQMLRALDDELRAYAAGAVRQYVRQRAAPGSADQPQPEDFFERAAAPFLRTVWPQERSLSTPGVSKALADLPATAKSAFVSAFEAISRFLVPFDAWSLNDYGLYGDENGIPKLLLIDTPAKALALLGLLDATVGTGVSAVVPSDLAAALGRIEEVAPETSQGPSFRRLAAAARR